MSQSRRPHFADGAPSSVSVSLTELLHRPVVDCDRRPVGRVCDVVAEQSDGQALLVAGLVAAHDDRQVFVAMKRLEVFADAVVIDAVAGFDTPFERRPVDVLLDADVLGRRHVDVRLARLVRARDIDLMLEHGRWVVAGVEVEWGGWWHHLLGRLNRHRAHRSWDAIEPLTNTDAGPMVGWAGPGLGRLKPAQIADLLELASAPEKSDIIADLRTKPELEADVFEELDDNDTAELLAERPDREIAAPDAPPKH
jgi:PRC-barrel domain